MSKLRKVPVPPKLKLPQIRVGRQAVIALAFVGVSLMSGFAGAWLEGRDSQVLIGAEKKVTTRESQLISEIAKQVGPSVVSVNTRTTEEGDGFGFYGMGGVQQGSGTGIIISKEGIVITNRHVVPAGLSEVSITLSDGTELRNVSVIGRTNENDSLDIAFLKINDTKGRTLSPAILGDSSTVEVGDNVIAIGNALGQFQNTVTNGIISGYGRTVQTGDSSDPGKAPNNLDDLFQTDAAINEGNSGGPLVNLNGQVIGINTAIAGNAQNIGFAIPVNDVKGLVDQVFKSGKFSRPYLGVRYLPLTADLAAAYELKTHEGAFIVPSSDPSSPSVIPGSPAEQAGLKERDIIKTVNNRKVDQSHSLTGLLAKFKPGDRIRLQVLRGDKTLDVSITVGSMPTDQQ